MAYLSSTCFLSKLIQVCSPVRYNKYAGAVLFIQYSIKLYSCKYFTTDRNRPFVCSCLRPSVTFVCWSKWVNISSNCFRPLVAPPFSFSHTKCFGEIPTESTLSMGSNADGVWKIAIFDQYLALIRNRYKVGPKVTVVRQ